MKKNNKELKRDLKTQGQYIAEMTSQNLGNKKILAALKDIKDLHRNPVLHPEQYVTLEESTELLGIILSVISKIVREISIDEPLRYPPL